LTVLWINLGHWHAEQKDAKGALRCTEQACASARRLVDNNQAVTEYRHMLAVSQVNCANQYQQSGRRDEAALAYRQGMAEYQRLRPGNASTLAFQKGVAEAAWAPGKLQRDTDAEEAVRLMKQSVVGWETSIRIARQRAELHTYLVATLFNLGSTLEKLKRYDEAITANQQAGERSRAARETFPDKETWSIRM